MCVDVQTDSAINEQHMWEENQKNIHDDDGEAKKKFTFTTNLDPSWTRKIISKIDRDSIYSAIRVHEAIWGTKNTF